MKYVWILIVILLLTGCATPATVKQAIKKQSEAYVELQKALCEFSQGYLELNEHLFRLNQESQSRIEALSILEGFSGGNPSLNTWAKTNNQKVSELAGKLDNPSLSRGELLKVFNESIKLLEDAFSHGQQKAEEDNKKARKTLNEVKNAHNNTLGEIRSLIVIHDTVGEYLDIDLTPDPKDLKKAITDIKAIRK